MYVALLCVWCVDTSRVCMCVQAFPDFHVFVGLGVGNKYGSGKGVRTVSERYLQVGMAS